MTTIILPTLIAFEVMLRKVSTMIAAFTIA